MQIVIEISAEVKNRLGFGVTYPQDIQAICEAIANGIPLPKGHGRIIDESQITGTFTWDSGFIECFAPTIIEAEESEDV